MTLPASGPMSLTDVMDELRVLTPTRAYPISLGDADVRTLAGIASGPISMTDLYGKSTYIPMSGNVPDVADSTPINPSANYTKSVPISISFTDGIAPYSFVWSFVSGDGTVTPANAASTTVDFLVIRFADSGDVLMVVAQCVITDSTGRTLTRTGTVTLTLD